MAQYAREGVQTKSVVATIFVNKTSTTDWSGCMSGLMDAVHAFSRDISQNSYRTLDGTFDKPRVLEVILDAFDKLMVRQLQTAPSIKQFEQAQDVQVNFQVNSVYRRHKRLAVFDMDSTLIQQEVIDEIARKLGVEAQVSAITERAMNGELDFTASLRERCRLLKGVSANVFEELKSVITLSPGARDLVRAFQKMGYKTAVLSGGFTPLASWQAAQLGIDYAHANHLVVSADGTTLTGEVEGVIVDSLKKKELLESIAAQNGFELDQVIAIGDGANDLPMMWTSGLGVAFNAKERVQQLAPVRLNTGTLLDVLYFLGLTRQEIAELNAGT